MLETISDINIANVGSSANKIWSELKSDEGARRSVIMK
jgi:hypothetical protein